jgi:hypothetical protein
MASIESIEAFLLLQGLNQDGRVLLAITPEEPPASWTAWGLD